MGFGTIGAYIYKRNEEEESPLTIECVIELDQAKTAILDKSLVVSSFEELQDRSVQLVVEAANAEVVREFGEQVLQKSDLFVCSLTTFSDEEVYQRMVTAANLSGTRLYMPHGAILGLDGIHDGRDLIHEVKITTTKHPKSLGLEEDDNKESEVVFSGPTREACRRFPRNVNVHAAVALAGIGFDATISEIIADPNTERMSHLIEVQGRGLEWKIDIDSISLGGVTGAYTPESIYAAVKRTCACDPHLAFV